MENKMTKSKVDTKALDQANNLDTNLTNAAAVQYAQSYAIQRFEELIELFGTTTWQTENVARAFVSQAEYLVKQKNTQINKYLDQVQVAEENQKRGMAMSQTAIERAVHLKDQCEIELEDLSLYLTTAKIAYEKTVGKKYEPLPQRGTPNKSRTAAQRLADQKAEATKIKK